jgi:glycosyltransferase involved in cell wall biosynthesis
MKKRIRLFFFLPTYTFGGAERTSSYLLDSLFNEDFDVVLATSRKVYDEMGNPSVKEFIPIEDYQMGVWFYKRDSFVRDIKSTARILERVKPDIAFGMMHYPSVLLAIARKIYRIKGLLVASPRFPTKVYIENFDYFESKHWRKYFYNLAFKAMFRWSDYFIVASSGMKQECVSFYKVMPERIYLIPNSVDIDLVVKLSNEKVEIQKPENGYIITTVGRIEKEKRYELLIKAMKKITGRLNAHLYLIGTGTQVDTLRQLSEEMGVHRSIHFLGYQPNPFKFMKQSDLFIHTCLFEGYGNIILEAMACGVPVLSVDCPYGPRDIIKDGFNGMLTPADEEVIAEKAVYLLSREELRRELADRGLRYCLSYRTEDMANRYITTFWDIWNRENGRCNSC